MLKTAAAGMWWPFFYRLNVNIKMNKNYTNFTLGANDQRQYLIHFLNFDAS